MNYKQKSSIERVEAYSGRLHSAEHAYFESLTHKRKKNHFYTISKMLAFVIMQAYEDSVSEY